MRARRPERRTREEQAPLNAAPRPLRRGRQTNETPLSASDRAGGTRIRPTCGVDPTVLPERAAIEGACSMQEGRRRGPTRAFAFRRRLVAYASGADALPVSGSITTRPPPSTTAARTPGAA